VQFRIEHRHFPFHSMILKFLSRSGRQQIQSDVAFHSLCCELQAIKKCGQRMLNGYPPGNDHISPTFGTFELICLFRWDMLVAWMEYWQQESSSFHVSFTLSLCTAQKRPTCQRLLDGLFSDKGIYFRFLFRPAALFINSNRSITVGHFFDGHVAAIAAPS